MGIRFWYGENAFLPRGNATISKGISSGTEGTPSSSEGKPPSPWGPALVQREHRHPPGERHNPHGDQLRYGGAPPPLPRERHVPAGTGSGTKGAPPSSEGEPLSLQGPVLSDKLYRRVCRLLLNCRQPFPLGRGIGREAFLRPQGVPQLHRPRPRAARLDRSTWRGYSCTRLLLRSEGPWLRSPALEGISLYSQTPRAPIVKFTQYFLRNRERPDRREIKTEWIERVIASPLRKHVQEDGRIRLWGKVDEAEGRYLRVVLLEDGETVHNAFLDRRFREDDDAG